MECRRTAHGGIIQILFGLRDVDDVAIDQRCDIESASRKFKIPNRSSCAWLKVPHASIARSKHQRRLPVEHGKKGRAVGGVFGKFLGAPGPPHFTRSSI